MQEGKLQNKSGYGGQFPSSIDAVHALQYSMSYRTVLTSGKRGYCYSVLFSAQVLSLQDPEDLKGEKKAPNIEVLVDLTAPCNREMYETFFGC